MDRELSYWEAKRTLDGWLKRRDDVYQERAILRKNRELTTVEREYIWARLTEQLVELIATVKEVSRIVERAERRGKPNPFHTLSGLSDWRYEFAR